MRTLLRITAQAATLLLLAPAAVLAHEGSEPWLHVPAQNIEPGQPFELWGADLGAGAGVTVDVAAGDQSIRIGQVTADQEGHFTQTLNLPGRVSEGYAQLRARSDAGDEAFMWVLVGDQPGVGAPPAAPAGGASSAWWSDPSVIVLAAFLGGAFVALLWLVFRSRRPAAPAVSAARSRPLPRKARQRVD